jgi:hypothetical protein
LDSHPPIQPPAAGDEQESKGRLRAAFAFLGSTREAGVVQAIPSRSITARTVPLRPPGSTARSSSRVSAWTSNAASLAAVDLDNDGFDDSFSQGGTSAVIASLGSNANLSFEQEHHGVMANGASTATSNTPASSNG